MRIVSVTLLSLGLLAAQASAQAPSSWADKMFQPELTHDFGSIPRGAQLFHRFKMTNIYAVPLEIIGTRTSCGCVSVTTSSKVLKPHEVGSVEITMDARRFTGVKHVSVYVTVGPEYTSTATLLVSATSRSDVVFNPGEVNFGVIAAGQEPTQTIDVEYAGALDWHVTDVVKGNAPLDVAFKELYRRPGQVGYQITVKLKTTEASALNGLFHQELLVKTNDPASPHLPVIVEGTVQALLTVQPNPLSLGAIPVGEKVTKRVVIRAAKPFRITASEGGGDDIRVELPTHLAAVHIVTVTCQASAPGELKRQLTLKTDLTNQATAALAIEATIVPDTK